MLKKILSWMALIPLLLILAVGLIVVGAAMYGINLVTDYGYAPGAEWSE